MRRLLMVLLVTVMLAVPTSAAFAQDYGGGYGGYDCDPQTALSNMFLSVSSITDLDSLGVSVTYIGDYLGVCAGVWLNMLLEPLMGPNMDFGSMMPDSMDMGMDASKTSYTPEDAEMVLKAAFSGDVDTANAYLCENDQIVQTDLDSLGDVRLDAVNCSEDGDLLTCEVSATIGADSTSPVPLNDTVSFEVVDGKLCSTDN